MKSSIQKSLEMDLTRRVGIISWAEKIAWLRGFLAFEMTRGNDLATVFHYS